MYYNDYFESGEFGSRQKGCGKIGMNLVDTFYRVEHCIYLRFIMLLCYYVLCYYAMLNYKYHTQSYDKRCKYKSKVIVIMHAIVFFPLLIFELVFTSRI